MIQKQIDYFLSIVRAKQEIIPEIAQAEGELFQRRLDLAAEKKSLEQIGEAVVDAAILKAGGVKEFGSSEDIRKANAKRVKAQSATYIQQERMVEACEVDVQRQTDLLSDLHRRYGAIVSDATHHAALLQFLAAHGDALSECTFEVSSPCPLFTANEVTVEEMELAGF